MTLIGATTENPYFEVNSALLSRAQVYELEALSEETLRGVVRRGAEALGAEVSPEVEELIAARAGGDARNALEHPRARRRDRARGGRRRSRSVTSTTRRASARSLYDKGGDAHYDFDLGLDQVDARRRRAGVDLLPRGDARGRRGPRASSRGG